MTSPYLPHPKDWEVASLEADSSGEFVVAVSSGGTPSTGNAAYWEGGIPWLTPKEISGLDAIYVTRSERTLTELGLSASSAAILPAGTVMLSKRAPVGLTVVNAVPMATNQGFLNLRCGLKLDPAYLCLWLRTNKPYLDAVANGSTYPELYPGDLHEFLIAVPPIEEQRAVVQFVGAVTLAISLGHLEEEAGAGFANLLRVEAETQTLRRLREMVVPSLLAGDIRLSSMTAQMEVPAIRRPPRGLP